MRSMILAAALLAGCAVDLPLQPGESVTLQNSRTWSARCTGFATAMHGMARYIERQTDKGQRVPEHILTTVEASVARLRPICGSGGEYPPDGSHANFLAIQALNDMMKASNGL